MTTPPAAGERTTDVIDRVAGVPPSNPLHALRRQRDKVVAATQGSAAALFDPALPGLTLADRLRVALHACRLTPATQLAAHYRERLRAIEADARSIEALDAGDVARLADPRLRAMLSFTRGLIERPADGERASLQALLAAGIDTPSVVTLAQLVAFVSYQARVAAALMALQAEPPVQGQRDAERKGIGAAPRRFDGFTLQTLGWKAWLDVVRLEQATPQQIAVLEESHPQAKASDYYLTLVHQPEILRQRSSAFNAIMYAPGGLPRAERELAATVVSCINGCVFCASVHAQRFEQLAKRRDVIEQVFDDPRQAGTDERERAIVRFSAELTESPDRLRASSLEALRRAGLADLDILDLAHSVAIFAWANRLMLNLGEPVWPA